ncbi:hypothetical protein GGP41_002227 [Bipolaris sorokiniana]|uniref:Uncharacterized protein n=1 Tax=Cochliobolus sativus TaxID=45130 RepID=A0A8H5Z5W8_COCSA|nr:hypothetical protein GGP41_002227 [Bipolaris sorokiniana]
MATELILLTTYGIALSNRSRRLSSTSANSLKSVQTRIQNRFFLFPSASTIIHLRTKTTARSFTIDALFGSKKGGATS